MQIPLFWFLLSLLVALSWREMSSFLGRRIVGSNTPTGSVFTSRGVVGGKDIRRFIPPSFSSLLCNPNKHSSFSSSTRKLEANMSQPFLDAVAGRRSIYPLSNSSPIPDSKIQDIIKQTLTHVPSSFNSQTTRIVLLVKAEHEKLWEITKEVLKGVVPADGWAATEGKLNMFKAAYGTVLFFEARSAIQEMQNKYALYADRFPPWATQSDGMHQFTIWTALEAEGLGANLQHYNPLIDEKVAAQWGIDADWVLNAQLVFGKKEGEAGEKAVSTIEGERFKTFGA
ncbi:hypothetical protein HYALB_00008703 [Hymenoscyphus albidus]|uniref:Nitroreductase domain-containing protein n=1 Tax=Hymenoscyphus albidus TaxID=595503 RepID=A0A9N9LPK7_9HELO|nr:hypothetical protein HYALB_00008703 [Hymenoscyphus albidus]